jgi:predicted dehydrogenase
MAHYRAAVIGLTGIGAGPLRRDDTGPFGVRTPGSHVAAYASLPDTELVAVCDLKAEALAQFSQNWDAALPGVRQYTSHRELLANERIDLISVCTSDHAHAQIVVDACAVGVKGIFCEKPIATTLADTDRMIAAAADAGIPMSIDHTRRWFPLWQHAREQLRAGVIGELKGVTATCGNPRAMLFRNGTHWIDTIMMMADSEPEWVFADLEDGFEHWDRYKGDGGRDPAQDPSGQGYIYFKNGVRAQINASKQFRSSFTLDLFGTTGRITLREPGGAAVTTEGGTRPLEAPGYGVTGIAGGIDELIRHLRGECPQLTSPPSEARKTLQVLLGFLHSNSRGNVRINLADLADATAA